MNLAELGLESTVRRITDQAARLKAVRFAGCSRCEDPGRCCHKYMPIGYSDFRRWEAEKRWDILREIRLVTVPGKTPFFTFGKLLESGVPCPFLDERNLCRIHDTKPLACKNYPLTQPEEEVAPVCRQCGRGAEYSADLIRQLFVDQMHDLWEASVESIRLVDLVARATKLYRFAATR